MASLLDSNAVWLVTGCSSGLGKAIASHVYNAGHVIVATARNVNSLTYLPDGPKTLKLELDVTSSDSIDMAIGAVVERFGRIDVVINNAGYGSMGEAESFPEDEARLQVETNFWGPVRITKAVLPILRANAPVQGGTIVQVSSIGGYLAYQGNSFYHASKFALEGFTKSVAKEMNQKWNIKFLILSPGGVQTDFANNIKYTTRHPIYADDPESPLNQLIKYVSTPESQKDWAIPEMCAAVIFDAIIGQHEKPLPKRLNLGPETLPLMRADIKEYLAEMEEWEKETSSVARFDGSGENVLGALGG